MSRPTPVDSVWSSAVATWTAVWLVILLLAAADWLGWLPDPPPRPPRQPIAPIIRRHAVKETARFVRDVGKELVGIPHDKDQP